MSNFLHSGGGNGSEYLFKYSAAIVELIQVVLGLVGPLVANLLALLIGNGCAGIIVQLGLTDLINCLGLGQTLGSLLSGL